MEEKTKEWYSDQLNSMLKVEVDWTAMTKENLEEIYNAVSSLTLIRVLRIRRDQAVRKVVERLPRLRLIQKFLG